MCNKKMGFHSVKFKNICLSSFIICCLVILLSACGEKNQLTNELPEQSLVEFQSITQSSTISRASIVSTPEPVNVLSALLLNPNYNIHSFALVDVSLIREKSFELQSLTINDELNGELSSNIDPGNYFLTYEINANDPNYGPILIAQSTEVLVSILDHQTVLPSIPSNTIMFPDEDNDGFTNMEELLAGTNFQDPQSLPLPKMPTNVIITQDLNDIDVSWGIVNSATKYNIYLAVVSSDMSTEWVLYKSSSAAIRINNVVLLDVLDIYVAVSGENFAGEGLSSPQVSMIGDSGNSMAVSNLPAVTALAVPILKQSPKPDSIDVSINKSIKIEYNPLPNITKVWLEVTGVVPVIGRIRESLGKISFRPDSLNFSTTYTATVTFFELDINGIIIDSSYSWSFTTITEPLASVDTTPPRVSGLIPATDDVDIDKDSDISIYFSEPVDVITLDNGVLINYVDEVSNATSVNGRWGTRSNTAVFNPTNPLPDDTTIWVVVEAVADLAGNQVQSRFGSNFRTAPGTATPGTAITLFTLQDSYPIADQVDIPVNARLKFSFSQDVDVTALIVDAAIQLIDPNGNIVKGNWQGQGQTVIFRPSNDLQTNGATYIVQITGAVKSLTSDLISGAPIAWPFYTELASVVNTPFIWISANPLPGEQDVPTKTEIGLTFSGPVDLNSLNGRSGITIKDETNGGSITGSWRGVGNDIIFTPSTQLKFRSQYMVKIGTGVKGINGVAIPGKLEVGFITEQLLITDTIAPTWMGASPGLNEFNVSIKSEIKIKFDEAIDVKSVDNHTGIRIHGPSGAVISGRFKSKGNTIEFNPSIPMEYDSQYAIYLNTLTTDLTGNALNLGLGLTEMHWIFNTEPKPNIDTIAPQLMGFNPGLNTVNVPVTSTFSAKFDEPIDLASLMIGSKQTGIKIIGPTGADVAGSWTANGNEVIFTPFSLLDYNSAQYILIITGSVSDLAGNLLGLSKSINIVVYTENAP